MDEFLRRAPLMLLASGKPFQYPQTDWGDAVQMIGPCVLDPEPDSVPDWLAAVELPIVLVTTSSEKQADTDLVVTAMTALADQRVHVVATMPAARDDELVTRPNATVCRFVPHGVVLDRAVCAVTHGGMGATQKALARGVPSARCPTGAISSRCPTRRGGPVRHPPAREEADSGATAHEYPERDGDDGRCETRRIGFRRHRRHGPRRRPV